MRKSIVAFLTTLLALLDDGRCHSVIADSIMSSSKFPDTRVIDADESRPRARIPPDISKRALKTILLQLNRASVPRFAQSGRTPMLLMKASDPKLRTRVVAPTTRPSREASNVDILDHRSNAKQASKARTNEVLRPAFPFLLTAAALVPAAAMAAGSPYAVPDRTGFIGGIASVIESGINLAHAGLDSAGITDNYGICIFLFTLLIKTLTIPLLNLQIKTTSQLTEVAPISRKVYNAFPNKDDVKEELNRISTKLFKDVGVDPLASLWPTFAQLPVFFALSRALRNLVADDKLSEPFLWLPDLAGPRYQEPKDRALDWITSSFALSPKLGWEDTIAFLSLPIILLVSQKVSQSLLQPPREADALDAEMKEMPLSLKGSIGRKLIPFIKDNWPILILFYFALNSPAGLPLYWIYNNILTTVFILLAREGVKDEVKKSIEPLLGLLDTELKSSFNMTLAELEQTEVVEETSLGTSEMWIYLPAKRKPIDILSEPVRDSQTTGRTLEPEALFRVSEVVVGEDKVTFLKLADGRGWVVDKVPGMGQQCFTRQKFDQMADSMLTRGASRIFGAIGVVFLFSLLGEFLQQ